MLAGLAWGRANPPPAPAGRRLTSYSLAKRIRPHLLPKHYDDSKAQR